MFPVKGPCETFPWCDLLDIHNSSLMMPLFLALSISTHYSFLWPVVSVLHHELRPFAWYCYCLWNHKDQTPTAWNVPISSSVTQSLWLCLIVRGRSLKLEHGVFTFLQFFPPRRDAFHQINCLKMRDHQNGSASMNERVCKNAFYVTKYVAEPDGKVLINRYWLNTLRNKGAK